MEHTHITLAHGNGGRLMRELIEEVFVRHLHNPFLNTDADASLLEMPNGKWMMTTDGFSVQPLEFPGGNIGSLAVHGTVNDLAVAGAEPMFLSLNAFIEEGLEIALLDRIVAGIATAAHKANVKVVTGDTKVVRKGEGGGLYLATTGLGIQKSDRLNITSIRAGDNILVSGPVGDHGTAVMLAREEFGMRGDLHSDATSVLPLTKALYTLPGLRFMRDPTRGGLASVMQEIHRATGLGIQLIQDTIPVRDPVLSVCEMLGYDPLYLACEGRVVAVVAPEQTEQALSAWHKMPQANEAAIIGTMTDGAHVVMQTPLGGNRILEELEDEPLPRIC